MTQCTEREADGVADDEGSEYLDSAQHALSQKRTGGTNGIKYAAKVGRYDAQACGGQEPVWGEKAVESIKNTISEENCHKDVDREAMRHHPGIDTDKAPFNKFVKIGHRVFICHRCVVQIGRLTIGQDIGEAGIFLPEPPQYKCRY